MIHLLLALAAATAQPAPPTDIAAIETLDTRDDRFDRMTVPVRIGDHGPFAFAIDTGADRTVVSRELADELKLAPGDTATMHSMTGVGEVRTVRVPSLRVGSGTRDDLHAPALAEEHLGARGLLGVDSLKNQRVVMDFGRRTFSIADGRTREQIDPDTIVVTARSRYGQLLLVDADIRGVPITVILDSGAESTIGNLALQRVLMARRKNVVFTPDTLIDVTGGKLPVEKAMLDAIRIGGVVMSKVEVAFADAHPFSRFGLLDRPAMLLGMSTLRSFSRVSIDFAQRKVRFLLPDQSRDSSREPWFAFRSPDTTSPL